MSWIFDSFANTERAEGFVAAVKDKYDLEAEVFDTQQESDAVDPFPFVLTPPIVLVERLGGNKQEENLKRLVREYGGDFAGT